MTLRQLYATRIGEVVQSDTQSSKRRRLATAGALNADDAAVSTVAPEAGEQRFRYMAVGGFASLAASAVEELAGAANIGAVPYATVAGDDPQRDGYFVVGDEATERPISAQSDVQRLDISLTREGTRGNQWRAIQTKPQTVDNPFGSDAGAEVGAHAAARKVQWYDATGGTGAVESATVQRTVTGERADINIYDATEPTFDDPALIYTLPYEREYQADAHLWDDHARAKTAAVVDDTGDSVGSATVGDATIAGLGTALAWGRVYGTGHDYVGERVAETGALRLRFDESRGRLKAWRWDDADAVYQPVQLDASSSWRLYDVDITDISLGSIDAQVEFRDTSAASLTTHNLDVSLKRGYEDALWTVPANGSTPPQGLIDRVDAIASTQGSDPAAATQLIPREDVDA